MHRIALQLGKGAAGHTGHPFPAQFERQVSYNTPGDCIFSYCCHTQFPLFSTMILTNHITSAICKLSQSEAPDREAS